MFELVSWTYLALFGIVGVVALYGNRKNSLRDSRTYSEDFIDAVIEGAVQRMAHPSFWFSAFRIWIYSSLLYGVAVTTADYVPGMNEAYQAIGVFIGRVLQTTGQALSSRNPLTESVELMTKIGLFLWFCFQLQNPLKTGFHRLRKDINNLYKNSPVKEWVS